jgi:hypothetical protein
MTSLENKINSIDKLIYAFLVLFVITLNNSIFLSQIGFFATYFLIGIKSYYLKENPFKKNELNLYIIIFILVLIVTAIFSIYREEALIRSIKKILLIPIFYSIIYFVDNRKKADELFKFYLYAAIATIIFYLGFSIHHYLYHLYSLEQKGPSPFQYVMTAGGLMSFVAVFSFAFLINENVIYKKKIFYMIAFLLSFSAVIASYTRAAWLGMIAGILVILLMKKKWQYIFGLVVILATYLLLNQNESKIKFYELKNDSSKLLSEVKTEGKASEFIITPSKEIVLADYNNGILIIKNGHIIQRIITPSPVSNLCKWNDSTFISSSIDQRFFVLKKDNGNYRLNHSFYSVGKTVDFKIANNKLFVADEDSGLTIYNNPNTKEYFHFPQVKLHHFAVIDSFIVGYNYQTQVLKLFKILNLNSIITLDSIKIKSNVYNLFPLQYGSLFQTETKLIYYLIENNRLIKKHEFDIIGAINSKKIGSSYFLLTASGKLYRITPIQKDELQITLGNSFKEEISDFNLCSDTLIISTAKRNRLSSIYDPNHITNYERINIWKTGIKIFKDYWLTGIGDLDLQKIYKVYKEPYLKENFGHLHNNFINWLVTFGLIGTLLILIFIVKVILFYYSLYKTIKNEPFVSSIALGSFASLFCFLFTGTGEYNFGDQEIMTVMWFILGLNYAYYQLIIKERNSNV